MSKNILVIDDDGMVCKTLCGLLNKTGYQADALNNGFDAIEKIKDTHIDLIVVDIKMPGINGVDAVKRIKDILKSRHRHDVPVIFITGFPDCKEVEEARKFGLVVSKPFDNEDFLDYISHYTR